MDPIVQLVANALPGEKKFVLFVGAGVSKDAGVPTAWDLMMKTAQLLYAAEKEKEESKIDIEKWFLDSQYSNMTYSELIGMLYETSTEQRGFLNKFLGSHNPGEVHLSIANLARKGLIRAIITTNFDNCIEKACEQKGVSVQVISSDEDLKKSEPLIQLKELRIYKPHGTIDRGALKNTPADLVRLSTPMEKELLRVLSEHGVIVVGYAGEDKGIQRLFSKRNRIYYQLFWVNPVKPEGEIKRILERQSYKYILCSSANRFFNDFFTLLDRMESFGSARGIAGPTLIELKDALSVPKASVAPLFREFLDDIYNGLQSCAPSIKEPIDESILRQIEASNELYYGFLQCVALAVQYSNEKALKEIYDFFGRAITLYEPPEDPSKRYPEDYCDGYIFLVYEMFVSFIALLLRDYENWSMLRDLLKEYIFLDRYPYPGYYPISQIDCYIRSLDEDRNRRLNLNRRSVVADLYHSRHTSGQFSQFVNYQEFMDAEFFLVLLTTRLRMLDEKYRIWYPRNCVYMRKVPLFLVKAEKKVVYAAFQQLLRVNSNEELDAVLIAVGHSWYEKTRCPSSPIEDLDGKKLNRF